ncbi:MAG TPA: hypothetical protein VLA62_05880 [Solirubrobacterales bacterium]|nr:hypothetical protein [Solirubrobacterales bacterium]
MKRSIIAFAILGLLAGTAHATPGDPRIVQGILEWPPNLAAEPFVVIRGEDGQHYYADLSAAQRRTPGALTAGARVAVLGVEGSHPYELAALAFGPGDATSLGLTAPVAPSAPSTSAPSTGAAPIATPEPMWRLNGAVHAVSGTMLTLRTDDGRTHVVDASQLSTVTIRALEPGDRVTLFGVPRRDDKLVANGYIQSEPATPAASPPSMR